MLGFDPRAARAAWSVFLVALLLLILYYIRSVLLVFVLAVLFAYMLAPLVNLVDRFLPSKRSRTYSLAAVYTLLIAVLVLAGVLVGNRVAEESVNFAKGFPGIRQSLEARLQEPGPAWLQPVKSYIFVQIREHAQDFNTVIVPLLQKAGEQAASVLGGLLLVVLVPILGFFFLKDGREIREQVLGMTGPTHRAIWEDIANDVHALLGQFIRALVILSLATFAFYGAFFGIIGLPYAMLLATVAAALEFIPMFGPLAAAVLVVSVAIFSGFGHVLILLVFLAAYRIFQDYILSPHLMSSGVALHPLLVIFGALAGEQLAGVPGMFLSVPVLATLRVIYVRIQKARVSAPVQ